MRNERKGGVYTPAKDFIGASAMRRARYTAKVASRPEIKGVKRKAAQGMSSKDKQFPNPEKLNNGNHRYYMKHGILVDRAA